jgi:hypothetical protein
MTYPVGSAADDVPGTSQQSMSRRSSRTMFMVCATLDPTSVSEMCWKAGSLIDGQTSSSTMSTSNCPSGILLAKKNSTDCGPSPTTTPTQ